jgi:hypothetical protein
MIQAIEIFLALLCWALAFVLYLYILPIMRAKQGWHVMSINVFGMFSGYLGFEFITDSAWIDDHYAFYLIGNSLFPIAGIMVTYGYWREGRARKNSKGN